MVFALILLQDLLTIFSAKNVIFSIASAVGKPVTVDLATKNKIRPNCAKLKIKVNLVEKFPNRVKINKEDDITREIKSKWIQIQYDYMPKYCRNVVYKDIIRRAAGMYILNFFKRNKKRNKKRLQLLKGQKIR